MMALAMNHDGGHSDCEWCDVKDLPHFTQLLIDFLSGVGE